MARNAATPPPPTDDALRDLIHDPDLESFTSQLPDARKVSIRVMNETSGNWRHKGSTSIESFSLDWVQQRFGGGTYQFSFHAVDGKLLKTISNIEIDALPESEQKIVHAAATISPAPSVAISEVQLLREQMAADRIMLLKLIDSIGNRQPQQSDIGQLMAAFVQLKQLEPKRENPPELQTLLMQSFEKGLDLAGKIQGKVSGEASPMTELIGFARDVFKDAQPLIQSLLTKQNPPKTKAAALPGAAAEVAEGEEETDDMDLTPALTFIKDNLSSGFNPTALAEMVLHQMKGNPELNTTVSAIVMEQPIEDIVKLDAELAIEPMRTKFGEFFGVLRARISANTPTT